MLNFFAVGLDGFAAKMKLLGNLPRAVCSAQKLKHLHLAVREALDSHARTVRFFAQGSLHYRCGDSFAKVQFARQDFAHRLQHPIGGVFFSWYNGNDGTERTLFCSPPFKTPGALATRPALQQKGPRGLPRSPFVAWNLFNFES